MITRETVFELFRFGIVGIVSTVLHYVIYWVLQHRIEVNIAYTIGYILSFLANYWLSAHFTFHRQVSVKNGIGFGGAHAVNYMLHIVLLNFFLWLGLSNEVAPLGVFAVAIPVNFILVRFVFHHTS